jgi:hypothetical protein
MEHFEERQLAGETEVFGEDLPSANISTSLYTKAVTFSENGVLRRILGPKRDEVAGGVRKLHNEEFY